tara:strand:- start:62 stop:640 length:579 start_codon:yes stop_codon:yes gene_type:complete
MAINVKIEREEDQSGEIKVKIVPSNPDLKPRTIELVARRAVDGKIMVFDHYLIDVVIAPEEGKVITFSKTNQNDLAYEAQDRLFRLMQSKGLIMPESVKSGNIYGSLEASYPTESKYADTTNVALYLVHEFMQDEGKFLQLKADVEREEEDRLMDPDAADSTELGEIPHEERKGTQGVIDYYPSYYYGSVYE